MSTEAPPEKERTPTRKTFSVFLIILALIGIAVVVGIILLTSTLSSELKQTLAPIQQANAALNTQVSQLLHPTPTLIPDPVSIIHEVQSLARLETIQYSVEKVITAEVNQGVFGPLFGDRLLFVAHGYVIAGVDLAKLSAEDLRFANDKLYVSLPEAEIFVATLNNNRSFVYDRETGILRAHQTNLETEARKLAEQEILRTAEEDGILLQAAANAESYLRSLFAGLGYTQVIFE